MALQPWKSVMLTLSQWCYPTISSSVILFSSHLQSFPPSWSFLLLCQKPEGIFLQYLLWKFGCSVQFGHLVVSDFLWHMDFSTPEFPVHQFPEFTQIHVHSVGDAIQPPHPLFSPSPPTFNLSQHQSLFQWVGSSHHVAKLLEFELRHQPFQWIFRTDFL